MKCYLTPFEIASCPGSSRKRNAFWFWGCSDRQRVKGCASAVSGYRHLVLLSDRVEIERLLAQGVSQAGIARALGCHPSTVSREIRRRSFRPERVHASVRPYLRRCLDTRAWSDAFYVAETAQGHADRLTACSHQPYRITHDRVVDTVMSRLRQGWTPEEIAGRLPIDSRDDPSIRVSHETLYSWVCSVRMRHRALWNTYRGLTKNAVNVAVGGFTGRVFGVWEWISVPPW